VPIHPATLKIPNLDNMCFAATMILSGSLSKSRFSKKTNKSGYNCYVLLDWVYSGTFK